MEPSEVPFIAMVTVTSTQFMVVEPSQLKKYKTMI